MKSMFSLKVVRAGLCCVAAGVVSLLTNRAMAQTGEQDPTTNPYIIYLNAEYSPNVPTPPTLPTGTYLSSTWQYDDIGITMQEQAWALTDTNSNAAQSPTETATLTQEISNEMTYLLNPTNDLNGFWYPNGNLKGDSNVNRFTLSTILEVLWRLQQKGILSSSVPGWESTAQVAVNYQYNNYGEYFNTIPAVRSQTDYASKLAGIYPNQDAAYAEIMGDANLIYNTGTFSTGTYNYSTSAKNAVKCVSSEITQPGGTVTYMDGTGAEIDYTDIDVNFLGLYYMDTQDANATAAIQKLVNYYPRQMVGPGISEAASAPWFKTSITPLIGDPAATDAVAAQAMGQTEDPVDAYLAQQMINYGGRFAPDAGGEAVMGAYFWRPNSPLIPSSNVLLPDFDINGSRGHFGAFNWVHVMNTAEDTCVGATVGTANFMPNPNFSESQNGQPTFYTGTWSEGSPTLSTGTIGYNGSNTSAKITGTTTDRGYWVTPGMPLIPGHNYTLSLWQLSSANVTNRNILIQGSVSNVAGAAVTWATGSFTNGGWITSESGVTDQEPAGTNQVWLTATSTSSATWTPITFSFTVPTATTTLPLPPVEATFFLYNYNGNGSVWYDDLSFVDNTAANAGGNTAVSLDSALELITPEVGMPLTGTLTGTNTLYSIAAYTTPLTYQNADLISANGDFAIASSVYSPQMPTDPTDNNYGAGASSGWTASQTWLSLPDRMVGTVTMTNSLTPPERYIRVRIRTAPGGMLKPVAVGSSTATYTASNLSLHILSNTFPHSVIAPAIIADIYGTPDADELSLSTATTSTGSATVSMPASASAAMSFATVATDTSDPLTGFNALTGYGNLTGFRAANALNTYYVFYNPTNSTVSLNMTIPTQTWDTLNNFFVQTGTGNYPGATVATPTLLTSNLVSESVPPYCTACVQLARNLISNPGFEQATGTGTPTGCTFEQISGSSTISLDSTQADVPHGGLNSVEVTGSGEGGVLSPQVSVVSGKYYQYSFWFKPSGVPASAIAARLTPYSSGTVTPFQSSWIESSLENNCTGTVTNGQLYIIPTKAPANTWTSASISFLLSGPTAVNVENLNWGGGGTVWFDDLSLQQTQ